MLIADRYRGGIPLSGKPDSAQVSIINSPAAADGVVQSVRLRLAVRGRWRRLLGGDRV
jgi:hypothetical protein